MNGVTDLVACLKKGLKDKKNKALLRLYLNLSGKVAEAVGKEFTNLGKQLILLIMSCLSDKQTQVRADTLMALEKFEKACGIEFICSFAVQALIQEKESVEIKIELLTLLNTNSQVIITSKSIGTFAYNF